MKQKALDVGVEPSVEVLFNDSAERGEFSGAGIEPSDTRTEWGHTAYASQAEEKRALFVAAEHCRG